MKKSDLGGIIFFIFLLFLIVFDLAKSIASIKIIVNDGWHAWWTSGWAMVGYVIAGIVLLFLCVVYAIVMFQKKK